MSTQKELEVRRRLKDDFEYYAPRVLKIITKKDERGRSDIKPFQFNSAQKFLHRKLEEQKARTGYVRALVLKGRQQGISTYTEGRFYWKTSNNGGEKTFILTHAQQATDNLFGMAARYHDKAPEFVRPALGKRNASTLEFNQIDSSYQVATAGSKGVGRSSTLTNVHGSEVAFWENSSDHLSGLLQAVPLAPGTEIILESTAYGVGNTFHDQWVMAERGESDFMAVFIPWFWQEEYRREVPQGFRAWDDEENVPEGEQTEREYQEQFKLSDEQIFWRRRKIIELGGGEEGFFKFKQEYPATADEAFQQSSGNSFLPRKAVLRARKSTVATEGDLIIGVDPSGGIEGRDRTAIIRRRTRRLFDPQLFTTLNTMQQVSLIHRIIKKEKPRKVFIDVGGLGRGIIDRLAEFPDTVGIVVPVNFGEAALDPEQYCNRKAEMAWLFKEWLEDLGGANIPDTDEVQADLLASVADDPDSNQRKRLKPKKWMRSKGLRSPDLFDAACLTFALPVAAFNQSVGNSSVDWDAVDSGSFNNGMIGNSSMDFDPL